MTKRWTSKNPAVEEIAAKLAGAFSKVEAKIKGELKAEYRDYARLRHEGLMQAAKDPKYTGYIGFDRWYRFTKFNHDAAVKEWERTRKSEKDYSGYPANSIHGWDDLRRFAEFMSVSYEEVDRDADDAFDRARDSFIMKNMAKIENVLAGRPDVEESAVDFKFNRKGVFEGGLTVRLADARFRAEVGLKYVVRTNPRLTPYFQYPLLFTEAEAGGKIKRGPSEEEVRILLGGGPAKTPEEIRAEKGYCAGSARVVPADAYAAVAHFMTPYMGCPECGQTVSVKGGKYRTHYPKKVLNNGGRQ